MYAAFSLRILCLVIVSTTHAHRSGQPRSSYIVHMNVQSMPRVFSDHRSWYLNTLSSVLDNREGFTSDKLIYSYSSSLHGFSATLSRAELESLKKHPGFISCTHDRRLELHTTHTPEFLGLGSASRAWPDSAYGEDVIIGFVDTGIWPKSPSFHDQGIGAPIPARWRGSCESGMGFSPSSCNRKLIGVRFFYKGLLANLPNGTLSMDSALDTAGHGTHTSSTAAGNFVTGASYFGYATGTAKGVAPHARIAMYKAVWTHGVYSSDVIAAIDRAIEDGVDVLSLSLGFSSGGSFLGDDPIAVASFAAMEKGIFVAASAGNDGPLGWSLMNGAPWIMTVGAGTVDREFYGTLTLGSGATISFRSLYPGKPLSSTLEIVFMGACDDVQKLKLVLDKMVVCKETLGISAQVENAMSARVSAAVFITGVSVPESYTRSLFSAAFIGSQDGKILMDYIQGSSKPKGRLEFQKTRAGTRPAPRVERYSSRGPFSSCPGVLKPDLIAPGTQVLASWPPQSPVGEVKTGGPLYSSFNLVSGTSMAAPHVAGAAALVKSIHPGWSPAAIRSALMTTAYLLDNMKTPIKDAANYDNPARPLDIGSGHVNPSQALHPGLVYDENHQGYISLLCRMNYKPEQLLAITRSASRCSSQSSDLNYPSFITFTEKEGSSSGGSFVKEFRRVVTNVGDERSSYTAKVVGLEGISVKVEPSRLMFKEKNEKLSFKLGLEGPRLLKEEVVYGYLIWVEDSGKYSARSPIVVTSIVQD